MALRVRRVRAQRKTPFRVKQPRWVDPFPHIPGTLPEKQVFAALVQHRLYFIYQGQIPELERGIFVTLAIPGFKPDFVLPEYKVIIDPFSEFHHSQPEAVRRDIRKMALYTALGYKFYHPWAHEITGGTENRPSGVEHVLQGMTELWQPPKRKLKDPRDIRAKRFPGYRLGPYVGLGATSVAAANVKRRKPPKLSISVGTRRGRRRRPL